MKVVCAPDSFKGAVSASQAAAAMASGVRDVLPAADVVEAPIADGGEGTVEAMLQASGGEQRVATVRGPLGQSVEARWGLIHEGRTAVIELAAAAGLTLVTKRDRNPMHTSTYGVGQIIREALDANVERIILGLGGSGTNDGGCGMAQALGVKFYDCRGDVMHEAVTGEMLSRLGGIDMAERDVRLSSVALDVACDVTNPLTGPRGAAAVYAPQKGASASEVKTLDAGLVNLKTVWAAMGPVAADAEGFGAAGGAGGGSAVLLGGTLRRGIDLVLGAIDFDELVNGATVCLTGEGMLDGQSLSGKAVLGVAGRAGRQGVPTAALVGAVGEGWEAVAEHIAAYGSRGESPVIVIGEGLTQADSMRRCGELLRAAAGRVVLQYMKP